MNEAVFIVLVKNKIQHPACWNANLYSRMADKLSKERNFSTFKNVSIDNGVIGMQGKAPETRKTVILTQKQNKKTHGQITQKKFYVNSTEMYM